MQTSISIPESILVTGTAGFIGSNVSEHLLQQGHNVIGIDNFDPYYDLKLKHHRLDRLKKFAGFQFQEADIVSKNDVARIFSHNSISAIAHLAAKAGVRASIEDPQAYVRTNILGTINLLHHAHNHGVNSFVLASTSSLYSGMPAPYSENQRVDHPLSPYAASKLGAEAQAHVWHHLYGLNVTILRYFTVYGPCGRPDMSPFKFIECVRRGINIPLYGDGTQSRDFTYIDDVACGTVMALALEGYNIINIGGGKRPSTINEMLALIGENLGREPSISYLESHPADMETTAANISKAKTMLDWAPSVDLAEGIRRTARWHLDNADLLDSITL